MKPYKNFKKNKKMNYLDNLKNTLVKFKKDSDNVQKVGLLSNINFKKKTWNFHKFNETNNYHCKGEINLDKVMYITIDKDENTNLVDFIARLRANNKSTNNFKEDSELQKSLYLSKKKEIQSFHNLLNTNANLEILEKEELYDSNFNQIKFNETNFDLHDNYKETLYNSTIDDKNFNNLELKEINSLTNEIKNTKIKIFENNKHYLEEKIMNQEKINMDENEENYSSVVRDKDYIKNKLKLKYNQNKQEKTKRQNVFKAKLMINKVTEFTPN